MKTFFKKLKRQFKASILALLLFLKISFFHLSCGLVWSNLNVFYNFQVLQLVFQSHIFFKFRKTLINFCVKLNSRSLITIGQKVNVVMPVTSRYALLVSNWNWVSCNKLSVQQSRDMIITAYVRRGNCNGQIQFGKLRV